MPSYPPPPSRFGYNAGMSDERKRRSPVLTALVAIVAVAILYVLSFGPATARCHPGWQQTIDFAYAPLFWLCNEVPTATRVLGWYVGLWSD